MKKSILLYTLLSLGVSGVSFGQTTDQSRLNHLAIGFNLNQFQKDFGLGVNLTSPYFFHSLALRASANVQWLELIPVNKTEVSWSPYSTFKLGILSRTRVVEDKIYIYGEGGLVTILPNQDFSEKKSLMGGYGVFGFEFIPTTYLSFFIELGGMGTGAKADKIISKPIYSNGFTMSVGMRIYL